MPSPSCRRPSAVVPKLTRLSNLPGLEPAGYFEVNAKGESGAAAGIDNDQERPFQYRGEVEVGNVSF